MQELRPDPDLCWFQDYQQAPCPYELLASRQEVVERLNFAMTAIESWSHTDRHTKVEETKYGVSPERFQMALKIYGVPLRVTDPPSEHVDFLNGIHALRVTRLVAEAMVDAPKQTLIAARQRRRERRGEDDG